MAQALFACRARDSELPMSPRPPESLNSPIQVPDAPPGPTIFEALREQLGLKLEERKTPLGVLVIDRVERVPIEN
jgi:uncharacterized protein (TIGR03435 family)